MKQITAYEFKDFSKEKQKEIYIKLLNDEITSHMEIVLPNEPERWQALVDKHGQYYLDSTPWFIPQCYFELYHYEICYQVKCTILDHVFSASGVMIDC